MSPSERLIAAKNMLMETGWITGVLRTKEGYHCALGAVYDTQAGGVSYLGRWRQCLDSLLYLYQAIPGDKPDGVENMPPDYRIDALAHFIATYNNRQTDINVIYAWFDRAIELAQAAEMYQELTVKEKEKKGEDLHEVSRSSPEDELVPA